MDAAPSAFMVLTGHLVLDELAVRPPKKWAKIQCASKKAHGCGKHGEELVEDLSLWLSLFDGEDDLNSSLCIRMSDDALRSVQADLGISRSMVDAEGSVQIANQERLVLTLFLRRQCCVKRAY